MKDIKRDLLQQKLRMVETVVRLISRKALRILIIIIPSNT
jgi:hypothetical protein